jgi:hypothetical protein
MNTHKNKTKIKNRKGNTMSLKKRYPDAVRKGPFIISQGQGVHIWKLKWTNEQSYKKQSYKLQSLYVTKLYVVKFIRKMFSRNKFYM